MIIAPGYIDMPGQSELTILVNPHLPSKKLSGHYDASVLVGRFLRSRYRRRNEVK